MKKLRQESMGIFHSKRAGGAAPHTTRPDGTSHLHPSRRADGIAPLFTPPSIRLAVLSSAALPAGPSGRLAVCPPGGEVAW